LAVTAGELKTTAFSDALIMTNGTKAAPPQPERPQRRSEFVERFVHPGLLHSQSEMVWNHYENRQGLKAPFTKQAAGKMRPEGAAWQADHPGFGTLCFTRP